MRMIKSLGVMVVLLGIAGLVEAGNIPQWGTGATAQRAGGPAGAAPGRPASVSRARKAIGDRTWSSAWNSVWATVAPRYRVQAAQTVRNLRVCRGDMAATIHSIVAGTIRSINHRRYGDAVRNLAAFQDKLMCLDARSMRNLDFIMAAFFARASMLPPREREKALKGALNLALLVFDQVQYTGRSSLLPVLHAMRRDIDKALATYDGKELGIWLHDYRSGTMQRQTFDQNRDRRFLNGLMAMIREPSRFGKGECSMLEMAAQGFSCGGMPGLGGGGGGGGGGGMPPTQAGQLGCMTAAAMQAGLHGQLSCMVKSGAGKGRFDPNKGRPGLNVSVLDQYCAGKTSQDSGSGGKSDKSSAKHENANKVGEGVLDFFSKMLDRWTGGSESKSEGSGKSGGGSGSGKGRTVRPWTPEDTKKLLEEQRGRKKGPLDDFGKDFKGSRGYSPDGGGAGACSSATNAMVRANALFNCSGAGSGAPGRLGPGPGQNAPGTRIMPAPGSSGSGGGGGLMACAVQGGGLVRTSMNDNRCQQAMCSPGQTCSCNARGVNATPEMREAARRSVFRPNRTFIRDPRPGSDGGFPGGGGGAGGSSSPTAPGGKGPRGGGYR